MFKNCADMLYVLFWCVYGDRIALQNKSMWGIWIISKAVIISATAAISVMVMTLLRVLGYGK